MFRLAFAAVLLALAPCDALVIGSRAPMCPSARAPMRNIRAEEPMPPPPSARLGATVDQDGKSNVWAVEPSMKVESKDKGILAFAPVAAVGAAALIAIPLLPMLFAANPDQA